MQTLYLNKTDENPAKTTLVVPSGLVRAREGLQVGQSIIIHERSTSSVVTITRVAQYFDGPTMLLKVMDTSKIFPHMTRAKGRELLCSLYQTCTKGNRSSVLVIDFERP